MLELEDKDFRISFCKYDRGMKEIMILMNGQYVGPSFPDQESTLCPPLST